MCLVLAVLLMGAVLFGYDAVFNPPVVVIYPSPGDLSQVEDLKASRAFSVKVNDTPVFVYETLKGWSFFSFSFRKTTAKVEVTVTGEVRDWEVRPARYRDTPQRNGGTFTFTLTEPRKIVLQINGPEGLKLLISAEQPEVNVPSPGASNVLYFAPGVHWLGYRFAPPPGIKIIYLAPGSVVEGTLRINDRPGLKIIGRGIFSMGEWPHDEEEGLNLHYDDGLLVEGITVVNSPGWQLSIGGSDWAVVRNVKLLATKDHYNTDGIQTWSQTRVRVEDFFIRANDDSFAVNQGTTHFTARDGLLWNGTNGASFMLGWGGDQDSHDIVFENIDVLENGSCCAGVFAMRWGGESPATILRVTYRNIGVEHAVSARGLPVPMFDLVIGRSPWNKGDLGKVMDIRFEHVTFPFGGGRIQGHDQENGFYGIRFANCTVAGTVVGSTEQLQIALSNAFDMVAEH